MQSTALWKCVIVLMLALFVRLSFAQERVKETSPAYLMTLDSEKKEEVKRSLTSGNKEEDLAHFKTVDRRLGADLGMMLPFGDFQKDFSTAPLLGLHFVYEAIPPLAFSVRTMRSSATHKSGAAGGKLTVANISVGGIGTFPVGRFLPFVRIEGSFNFNDVSFDASRVIANGNDTFITTVGINAGFGWDFVVGREVSLGLDATYHYSIPKKITFTNGTSYDIGSSYATVAFRVNF